MIVHDAGIMCSGAIFFTSVNFLLRRILNNIFHKRLSLVDQYLITEKCVNSVQAVMSTIAGVIIMQSCHGNIMTDTHWLTNTYALFGLPYFLYDICAMYNTHLYLNEAVMEKLGATGRVVHYIKHNIAMLIHHLVLPCIFFPIILYFRNNKGDYFVGVFYTCESAIPFISLRFILAQLKMKASGLYIVSGLLMIFVFFIVRICIFPFLYWKYGVYASIPFLEIPFRIPIKCNLGCFVVIVLQIYFLYLMLRGALRVFYKIYKQKNDNALDKHK